MAELLEEAEEDLVAFYCFPAAYRSKLRSTNPLEQVNREIGRRGGVVEIFPNDASAIRLAGAVPIEQDDEWLVGRGYLSEESLALVLEDQAMKEGRRRSYKPREGPTRSYTTSDDLTWRGRRSAAGDVTA